MATQLLACLAIGASDSWNLVGGGTKPDAVRAPDDDATTMISVSTINAKQSFTLDAFAGGYNATITDIATFRRTRENGSDSAIACRTYLTLGGNTTNGTANSPVGTTWLDTTETAWARPGGGTWTAADFDGTSATTEIGVEETTDSANSIQVTTLNLTVTYTPFAGGFALWVGAMLPPLLVVASHGLSNLEIAKITRRSLRHWPTHPLEFEAIRAAMRAT